VESFFSSLKKERIRGKSNADLLYDLAGQVVAHLKSYLANDDEVRNVLQYHQNDLVKVWLEALDYRSADFEKSKIGRILFTGYQRRLYPAVKFDSDTERRFSILLDRQAEKWFKPAKGQFQIVYQDGQQHCEYVPDFVAETRDAIYIAETKARGELGDPVVLAKKKAAEQWCAHATEFNRALGKKPWKYLLIAHDQVQENLSLGAYD
jgi:type III restriction enzyme